MEIGAHDKCDRAAQRGILGSVRGRYPDEREQGVPNRRNGRSSKTVTTDTAKLTLAIPRDRAGTFDPQLIAKYQRRFPDFDDCIISMYARGMSVREIRNHLEDIYGIDVSPDLISSVTDAVLVSYGSLFGTLDRPIHHEFEPSGTSRHHEPALPNSSAFEDLNPEE